MHTLRLKINDKVYDKLVWLLSKFNRDEIEVINEDSEFFENQEYLDKELSEINDGKANFLDIEDVDRRLEIVIKKHENSL